MKDLRVEVSITARDSAAVNRYLCELDRLPLIKAEDEVRLAKLIKAGDRKAEQKLVTANLRFVITVAKRYQYLGLPLADLISEGNIGLIEAARRFDDTKGFKFISYAVNWIRAMIISALEEHSRTIRLPRNYGDLHQKVFHEGAKLEQRLERTPTEEELMEYLDLPEWQIKEAVQGSTIAFSYDRNHNEGSDEQSFLEVMSNTDPAPDYDLQQDAFNTEIQVLLNELNTNEKQIICLSYGLTGERELSSLEIAKRLRQADLTVRKTREQALDKLRRSARLKIFLD